MVWTVSLFKVAQYMTWSLILWDYLITLDDEITLFWFSRRSWIKYLFFANRYIGLVLRIWDIVWEYLSNIDEDFLNNLCGNDISEGAYEACYVGTESASVLYVTIQLLVIETILVLRIWAIMGKRRRILWSFLGLLVCNTTASSLISICFASGMVPTFYYVIPTLIFEAIMFISAAYHGIKQSGGVRSLLLRDTSPFRYGPTPILHLVFQGSVLYFTAVLCSLPLMAFLDPRLGLTIMSVTISHMLLRLRKQGLSNTVGPPSQKVELTTFRATTNGVMSLEMGGDVIDIGPYPQGS